jgi:hypothetical protein
MGLLCLWPCLDLVSCWHLPSHPAGSQVSSWAYQTVLPAEGVLGTPGLSGPWSPSLFRLPMVKVGPQGEELVGLLLPQGSSCPAVPTESDTFVSATLTETHPRPPKPDPVKSTSSVLSSLTPAKSAPVINNGSPTILGKRSYEQHNGVDGEFGFRPPPWWGGQAGPAQSLSRPWGCTQPSNLTAPADGIFSPSLSCPWALPGNMKKRLLMPSRGKAWGGRWWGAVPNPVVMLCVLSARAVGGSGHIQGQSTQSHATAQTPCSSPFVT